MGTREEFLVRPDGVRIFTRFRPAPRPQAICLIAHGIAEHGGRYEHLARALNEQGFSCWIPDHRGHGRSGGRRGDCHNFDQFVDDLRGVAAIAQAQDHGLPLVLIGHSLGGLIALSYATRYGEQLRAVAVSSPALKLSHPPHPITVALITALAQLWPSLPLDNGVNPALLSHDPQVVAAYRADPLVHRRITTRCAVALNRAMQQSLQWATKLSIPCLMLQAGSDEICEASSATDFARSARNGFIALRRYDGFYHELFNEPERDRVIRDLSEWLKEVLAR